MATPQSCATADRRLCQLPGLSVIDMEWRKMVCFQYGPAWDEIPIIGSSDPSAAVTMLPELA